MSLSHKYQSKKHCVQQNGGGYEKSKTLLLNRRAEASTAAQKLFVIHFYRSKNQGGGKL